MPRLRGRSRNIALWVMVAVVAVAITVVVEAGKDVAFVEVGSAELVRDLKEVLGEALPLG